MAQGVVTALLVEGSVVWGFGALGSRAKAAKGEGSRGLASYGWCLRLNVFIFMIYERFGCI